MLDVCIPQGTFFVNYRNICLESHAFFFSYSSGFFHAFFTMVRTVPVATLFHAGMERMLCFFESIVVTLLLNSQHGFFLFKSCESTISMVWAIMGLVIRPENGIC